MQISLHSSTCEDKDYDLGQYREKAYNQNSRIQEFNFNFWGRVKTGS